MKNCSTNSSITHNKRAAAMMKPLSDTFTPGKYDVIVLSAGASRKRSRQQQSRPKHHHEGNTRYLIVLNAALVKYSRAQTKFQKWHLANEIATSIRRVNPNGGFVAQDDVTGQWYQVGEKLAVDIVSDNLHDLLERRKQQRRRRQGQARNLSMPVRVTSMPSPSTTMMMMAPPPRRVSI